MWRVIVAWEEDRAWMTAEHPTQDSAISQREKLLRDVRRGKVKRGVKWTAIVHDRTSSRLNGSTASVVVDGIENGHAMTPGSTG